MTTYRRVGSYGRVGSALAVLIVLIWTAGSNAQSQHLESPDTVPQGLSGADWSSIRAAYERQQGTKEPLAVNAITQAAYLKASNTAISDGFGTSVAISGDTVVVGAPHEDSSATGVNGVQGNNSASSAGAAYVFVRTGTTWTQQAYLKASNTAAEQRFGFSVAVSGDTIVVGSDGAGAHVFVRSGTTWTHQAYLNVSGRVFSSVAISNQTILVGAPNDSSSATGVNGNQNNTGAAYSGGAFIYVRSGTIWTQQAYLKASNTGSSDAFGTSVAMAGETVVIGAPRETAAPPE
ncbi:MAG: FG-GAP repeat protein [Verrucomicrobiales bacterium]